MATDNTLRTPKYYPAQLSDALATTWQVYAIPPDTDVYMYCATECYIAFAGADDVADGGDPADVAQKIILPASGYFRVVNKDCRTARSNVVYVAASTGTPTLYIQVQ